MAVLAELLRVVRELAAGHPSIERVEGLVDSELSAAHLRKALGDSFDEFYYAHDATGQVCRRLAAMYPRARRICIGDGFGMVYAAEFVAGYHRAPPVGLVARARAWLGARRDPAPVKPDLAALVLPVDSSGTGLRGLELTVCRKQDFQRAILDCGANARELQEHMRVLLAQSVGRRRYLLLTETYAEAGHMPPDREVRMYGEIIRAHCEAGSVVFVKPHPLESPGKAGRIREFLGTSHELVSVQARFGRHPIEIWLDLVRACTVISTAYPVLSLKYAHDVDVVQPMNDAFIEEWFEPAIRRWTRDSLRLYMEPLARLAAWDGRSVLWSGRRAA